MDELTITLNETVLLKGKKETICVCLIADDTLKDNYIRMGKVVRNNLYVKLGDIISIESYPKIYLADRIHVLPFEDSIDIISKNFTQYVIPYFKDNYRPVDKGDSFICNQGFREVEFKIVNVEPKDYGIVGQNTVIVLGDGEPIKRENEENNNDLGDDNIKEYIKNFNNESQNEVLSYEVLVKTIIILQNKFIEENKINYDLNEKNKELIKINEELCKKIEDLEKEKNNSEKKQLSY